MPFQRSRTAGGTVSWDRTTDVVVVGSGAAAYAAAATAAAAGSGVLVLEKAAADGGTTRRSGGGYWIPNNRFMRAAGMHDPRDWALKYMAKLAYPVQYDPSHPTLGLTPNAYELIEAFFDNAGVAIDHLEAIGALRSMHDPEQVDYNADLPEDKAPTGRYLNPAPLVNAGASHGNGEDLIAQMRAGAVRLGVEVLLEHEVRTCVRDEHGEVVGVEAQTPGGIKRFAARQGVVFGSGGFFHNKQMRNDYLRGPVYGGCCVLSNTGDFVRIGVELGADLGNMSQAWWAQVVFEEVLDNPSPLKNVWMPGGDAMILVNKYGRRVVNEKATYNERGQVHHFWDGGKREYPNLLLMLVYDESVHQNPIAYNMRRPIPMPDDNPSWVITGKDWNELTSGIRARLEVHAAHTGGYQLDPSFRSNLEETVRLFNRYAADGKDPDFERGETPIQTYWGSVPRAENKKNPTMYPFSERGPYHCILIAGGGLDTKGGPRTDSRARVLDQTGRPIPGLYGAGNCVASPAGQAYWSAGGTLGPAIAFGYIAGRAVVERPAREPSAALTRVVTRS
ncbi:MAG TPA: FAD-dependent oxidoreductase [Candidatus Dormibacteraeota bacterium]